MMNSHRAKHVGFGSHPSLPCRGDTSSLAEVSWPNLAGLTADDSGRTWQPYTDFLVYAALMALPWGGPELMGGDEADGGGGGVGPEASRLFDMAREYMEMRPRAAQPGLAPFFAETSPEDAAAQ